MTEREIFTAALNKSDPADRAAFLDGACGGDAALRHRVESLLLEHQQLGSFLDFSSPAATLDRQVTERPGTTIGPYKLLQTIGEGGMGVVYMAEQQQPVERRVALKIIKPGMDSRQVIARFEAERQALAMMDHQNIAKVFEAGTTDGGRPYFVMELVKGIPITKYCDEKRLSLKERLELMIPVCHAIQHAHQKGIIHRDIKPTNVLIAQYDGKPVPKVIDFGVAKATAQKLTERTMFTELGQVVGTIEYMSPEQAELNQLDIDTRSDIYSLGVLLYELLTGSTPFDKQKLRTFAFHEMLRIIREEEPPKPSTKLSSSGTLPSIAANRQTEPARLSKAIHGELDWIVMKALEKDRSRRYETANGFAADVQRYLDDEPVQACPPSVTYRLLKVVRRYKVAAIAASLVTFTILASSAFSALKYFDERAARREAVEQKLVAFQNAKSAKDNAVEATRERGRAVRQQAEAERQRDAVRQSLYYADMRLAFVDIGLGNSGRARDGVLSHFPAQGEFDRRGWEWYYLLSRAHEAEQALYGHRAEVNGVSWSPDGTHIASVSHDGSTKIWDTRTWKLVRTFDAGPTIKLSVHWSPDGRKLAWGSAHGECALRVWNRETGAISLIHAHEGSVRAVEWSHDGRYLATCSFNNGRPNDVRIWDAEKLESVAEFKVSARDDQGSLSWSSDDRLLAVAMPSAGLIRWNVASREKVSEQSFGKATGAAWHPSAFRLAIGNMVGECLVWDQKTGQTVSKWQAHRGPVTDVQWSRDASRLVSTGRDGTVKVWDVATGHQQMSVAGHVGWATAVTWDPDCKRFASSGLDGVIRVWNADPRPQPLAIRSGLDEAVSLAWDKRGSSLLVASASGDKVIQWDATTGNRLEEISLPSNQAVLASFRYGARLQPQNGGPLTLLLSDAPVALSTVIPPLRVNSGRIPFNAVLSPDGTQIAYTDNSTGRHGGAVMIYAMSKVRKVLAPRIYTINGLAWSPSGRHLAAVGSVQSSDEGTAAGFGFVYIFDSSSAERIHRFRIGSTRVHGTAVAWSHDGRRIAAGNEEGNCEIWEVASGRKLVSKRVHSSQVNDLAWSSDDLRIASGGNDGEVQLWDSATGEQFLSLEPHDAPIANIQWSPDGRKLAAVSINGLIQVWDATNGYELSRRDFWHHLIEPREWSEYTRLIEQERWPEAAEVLKPIVAAGAQDYRPLYQLALLDLQLDDQAGYREACKRMLTAFSDTEVAREAYSTAWSCALRPGTLEDYDPAIVLARRALDLKAKSFAYYEEALGAIMLRAGRYQDALQHLQAARETKEAPISSPARIAYLLAMTNERLRHNADAQMWLDRANQEAEKELNNAANPPNWNQRLLLKLFQNEASELIGPKADRPQPSADKGKKRNQRVRPLNAKD